MRVIHVESLDSAQKDLEHYIKMQQRIDALTFRLVAAVALLITYVIFAQILEVSDIPSPHFVTLILALFVSDGSNYYYLFRQKREVLNRSGFLQYLIEVRKMSVALEAYDAVIELFYSGDKELVWEMRGEKMKFVLEESSV